MQVFCPECKTGYEIAENITNKEKARLKCSNCGKIFVVDKNELLRQKEDNNEVKQDPFEMLSETMQEEEGIKPQDFVVEEIKTEQSVSEDVETEQSVSEDVEIEQSVTEDIETEQSSIEDVKTEQSVTEDIETEQSSIEEIIENIDENVKDVTDKEADFSKSEEQVEQPLDDSVGTLDVSDDNISENKDDTEENASDVAKDEEESDSDEQKDFDVKDVFERLSERTENLISEKNKLSWYKKAWLFIRSVLGFSFRFSLKCIIIVAIVVGLILMYNNRYSIVRSFPFLNGLYKSFGISAKIFGEGLEFQNINWEMVADGENTTLNIKGFVFNKTDKTIVIPMIHVEALDKDTNLLQSHNHDMKQQTVKPNDRVAIDISLSNPAPNIRYIYMTFVEFD
jgi:predicted Zn finger-like uncharacterized protein